MLLISQAVESNEVTVVMRQMFLLQPGLVIVATQMKTI